MAPVDTCTSGRKQLLLCATSAMAIGVALGLLTGEPKPQQQLQACHRRLSHPKIYSTPKDNLTRHIPNVGGVLPEPTP